MMVVASCSSFSLGVVCRCLFVVVGKVSLLLCVVVVCCC